MTQKITATIKITTAKVTAYDIINAQLVQQVITVKQYSEHTVNTLRKQLETETFKIVCVEAGETIEQLYEMDIDTFMTHAKASDHLNIGYINRCISKNNVKVLCMVDGKLEQRMFLVDSYKETEKDKALNSIRKAHETKDLRIIHIISAEQVSGYYYMSQADFMKYGKKTERKVKES